MTIGKRVWAIAEGCIPGWVNEPAPDFISYEAACILNTAGEDAHVEITIYFADKHLVASYKVTVPARRTTNLRFNNLKDPAPIPLQTSYSDVFVSDVSRVVQHTRLGSRQEANALITTIAYTE